MSYGISISGDTKVIVNSLTPAKKLRFLGAGVSVADNPGNGTFDITISGGGSGTVSAGANVGSGTGTVFRDITSSTINLKSIAPGSTKLSVTNNADDITLDVAEANLTLANLAGTIGDSKISALAYSKLTSVPTTFVPSTHASSHLSGGSDPIAAATTSARGTVQLATSAQTTAGLGVQASDTRLSDSRTPTAHASTHQSGGSDSIALDTLAAPTDITTLNADTSKHGLLKKLDNNSAHFMDGTGAWSTPTVTTGATPIAQGTSSKSGNASTKAFTIAHGMSTLPTFADVLPTSTDALGSFIVTMDATNITITYQVAPPSGTNNLTYEWMAMDINGGGGTGPPAGEVNTASNVGTGSGWFKSKTGVDLAFKSLVLGSTKLGVTSNTNDLTLDITEANLNIANMTGSIGNSRITDLAYSKLSSVPSTIVKTDQTNTYGAFAQIFPTSQLKILNPAGTFAYIMAGSAIVADRTVTWPLLTGNDTVVTEAFTQALTNKTIVAGSNTITGIVDANISAHTTSKITTTTKALLNSAIVYNDQTNTFAANDQVIPSTNLKLSNSGFKSTFSVGTLGADTTLTFPSSTDTVVGRATTDTLTNKTLTIPVITSISNSGTVTVPTGPETLVGRATTDTLTNKTLTSPVISTISNTGTVTLPTATDTLVARTTTDTLTNKTMVAASNTITDTSAATGDIMRYNGTRFARKGVGTGLQVLRTNSGATDIEWASLNAENTGSALASGNGSITLFNIPHSIGSTPSVAFVQCSTFSTAFTYTVDATNIAVTFTTAPTSGTNNVKFYWRAIA